MWKFKTCFLILFFFAHYNATVDSYKLKNNGKYSADCVEQINILNENPKMLFKMVDASSKYPFPGIAFSSNYDFGNEPECKSINIERANSKVLGKFCSSAIVLPNPFVEAYFQEPLKSATIFDILKTISSPELNLTQHDEHETNWLMLKENTNTAKMRNITLLSACVPHQCPVEDFYNILLAGIFSKKATLPSVIFTNRPCETIETNTELEVGDVIFLTGLGLIALLIVMSTGYDIVLNRSDQKSAHPVLLAFSLISNGRKLYHVPASRNPEHIDCLSGLRSISMMWIIAAHGVTSFFRLPLVNVPDVDRWEAMLYSQYLQTAPYAVDTFFFISGLLLSYGYLKVGTRIGAGKQLLAVPTMYLHRYLRLTPAMAMLFCFAITVFKFGGSGPLWQSLLDSVVQPCNRHPVNFFLYLQNLNNDDLCLFQTWYLSADMQFFVLAPIVVIPAALLIKKHFKPVMWSLIGFCLAITILVGVLQHFDVDVNYYERVMSYIIGIILGAAMRMCKGKPFAFSKVVNVIMWMIATVGLIGGSIFYHYVLHSDDDTNVTIFHNVFRPVWCVCLCWIVYSCHLGYGGFINTFLTIPIFQVGGRLSYCMYLLHGLVVTYWVGTLRSPQYFSDYSVYYAWCGHLVTTLALSTIWTLMFELPMVTVDAFIFGKLKPRNKQTNGRENTPTTPQIRIIERDLL